MSPIKTHTIKITGVPDGLLRLIDAKVRAGHYKSRSEYIRALIRQDVFDASPSLLPTGVSAKTLEETDATLARTGVINSGHAESLAESEGSHEAIYGDHA